MCGWLACTPQEEEWVGRLNSEAYQITKEAVKDYIKQLRREGCSLVTKS